MEVKRSQTRNSGNSQITSTRRNQLRIRNTYCSPAIKNVQGTTSIPRLRNSTSGILTYLPKQQKQLPTSQIELIIVTIFANKESGIT